MGIGWCMIMVYNCMCSCLWLNFWFNLNISYNGILMGIVVSVDN